MCKCKDVVKAASKFVRAYGGVRAVEQERLEELRKAVTQYCQSPAPKKPLPQKT